MGPEEFVSCLRDEVLADGLAHYRRMLEQEPIEGISDSTYRRIVSAYRSMTDEQRAAVLAFARLVTVDTLSHVLGILDGSSLLAEHRDDFVLTYGRSKTPLNGELQDLLLAAEEE